MNMLDVTIIYQPTATARIGFEKAQGSGLPPSLAMLPMVGDEIAFGGAVFSVLRRRIEPGPPTRVILTLDHPARPAGRR